MRPRLFVLLFVAGLLVLGILAIACGDDGDENDEDAIRDTLQLVTDACNAGDSERVQELETSALPGCPDGGTEDFEVLSVTVEGVRFASGRCTAKCQGQVDVTRTRADNGETEETTLIFRKEGGSWLLHGVGVTQE